MLVSTLPGLVLPCQSGQQWTWGRHHGGCCRGSRSAQCCTWVFQCSTLFRQMSTFSTFIQGVDHLLEVKSHAPVLHGLVNTQQTSIPKLFEHLDSFCIWWPCLIKSSPLLLGTSPPPPIGWQMGWCPEQSWLRLKLSRVYLDSNFTSSTILWAVFCISLCSSPKKLSCKRICEVHFEKWCKNAAMLKFLWCVTREV